MLLKFVWRSCLSGSSGESIFTKVPVGGDLALVTFSYVLMQLSYKKSRKLEKYFSTVSWEETWAIGSVTFKKFVAVSKTKNLLPCPQKSAITVSLNEESSLYSNYVPLISVLTLSGRNCIYLKTQSVPRSKHSAFVAKTNTLMLYREIIAVCSEIHTNHINMQCGQNVELLNVKLVVHIVTTVLWRVNIHYTLIQSVLRSKHYISIIKTSQLMLYKEIIAVCSQIHTKHNCTVGRTQKFWMSKLVVHKVSKGGRGVGLKILPLPCPDCQEILGASTSWSPKGLSSPVQG
jgi:hypothetical protein